MLAFVSCSKNKNEITNSTNLVHEIPTNSLDEAKILAKQSSVKCKTLGDCNESVAMLTVAKSTGLSLCTAFLLQNQILATNSHCIPKEIKNGSADCKDRISAIFPATKEHDEEKISCELFLRASPLPSTSDQDIAFLKLAPISRVPLTTDARGINDNQIFTLYKITPQKNDPPVGLMKKEFCKAVQNSFLLPSFNQAQRSTVMMADCQIQAGNSGAPLLNEKNEVSAIAQALVRLEDNPVAQRVLKTYSTADHFAPMLFASSFACIVMPGQERLALSTSCDTPNIASAQKYIETKIPASLEEEIKGELQRWSQENHTDFFWESKRFTNSNYSASYHLVPKCVKEFSQQDFNYQMPAVHLKIQFNQYLQSTVVKNSADHVMHLSVQKNANDNENYLADLFFGENLESPLFEEKIPNCN